MKRRQSLVIVVAVAAAAAYLLSTYSKTGKPREQGVAKASGTAEKDAEARPANASGAGLTRVADSEAAVPGGRDGAFTTAPARAADALIDPQPEKPLLTVGGKAGAQVSAGGRTVEGLAPNQFGEFPRVHVRPSQAVSVRVTFPEAEPGARVVAQVEDGGKFADGKPVAVLNLDEKRSAAFEFIAGEEPGAYRICVRNGPDWKYVQLWAANDPGLSINR